MRSYRRRAICASGLLSAGAILAACGSDAPTGAPDPPPPGAVSACQLQSGPEWTWTAVGSGQKAALALDSQGTAHLAFMLESLSGFIAYASVSGSTVSPLETIASGYFYGPIDIGLRSGAPVIAYHDHDLEDQVLAVRSGTAWTLNPMTHSGHDGWYNALAVDPRGNVHTATFDPSGFNGVGVNYGVWDGTSWGVEVAVPGSFDYAGGMSIALADDGTSYVAFFDDVQGVGRLAWRDGPGGLWSDQVIESKGALIEVGRFPDIAIDRTTETLHIVYLARTGGAAGTIRYARWNAGTAVVTDVAPVDNFTIGMSGARDIATIALNASGEPVVAIQNRSELTIARWDGAGFDLESFAAGANATLRQQTSIAIDAGNRTHVAYWLDAASGSVVCHGVG